LLRGWIQTVALPYGTLDISQYGAHACGPPRLACTAAHSGAAAPAAVSLPRVSYPRLCVYGQQTAHVSLRGPAHHGSCVS